MHTTIQQTLADPTRVRDLLESWLSGRLESEAWRAYTTLRDEVASGPDASGFCVLLSRACRHGSGRPLNPTAEERAAAIGCHPGFNPERWTELETLRVALVLSRPDLARESGAAALEEAFRYADMGELCALYRSLAFLPDGERFTWRCGEGNRTNILSVFEANALDTPYPASFLDDTAFRQAVIKCLHLSGPLWRLWGLDGRVDGELARMALDLADERHSAHRPVPPMLWLCLGEHGGERGVEWLTRELREGLPDGRRGAALGCGRAHLADALGAALDREDDFTVRGSIECALDPAAAAREPLDQAAFASLDPTTETHEEYF